MLTTVSRPWFLIAGLTLLLSAPLVHAQASREKPAIQQSRDTRLLNLNAASAEQLRELPGLGPSTAARIIEYRQKHGPFEKVEDLMNIRGIGEKRFLRLKPLVTVTPGAPARQARGTEP